jgi:hypothetical protein
MSAAEIAIAIGRALIEDLQDGVGVRIHLDESAAKSVIALLGGKPGDIPATIQIDPTIDAYPGERSWFDGGSHDGRCYKLSDQQRAKRTIVLEPGEVYAWDGRVFQFQGDSRPQAVE